MAVSSRSSSSRSSNSGKLKYCHPSYYLKRPKRLALLFIAFVGATFVVWDRQTLVREHEEDIAKLSDEVEHLRNLLEELNAQNGKMGNLAFGGQISKPLNPEVPDDPISIVRREKVKEAMVHAWASYEKYAWGQDELQPLSKHGFNRYGGLGATVIDSLDTLYIMGLHEQFQKAKEWVANSLDFNKDYEANVFETTIRLRYKSCRWTC